jgi:hypothetical protein
VKAVDSYGDSLELSFDVVLVVAVEVTAQIVTRQGSQTATSVVKKLCLGDIVFPGEAMQEHRSGVILTDREANSYESETRV